MRAAQPSMIRHTREHDILRFCIPVMDKRDMKSVGKSGPSQKVSADVRCSE